MLIYYDWVIRMSSSLLDWTKGVNLHRKDRAKRWLYTLFQCKRDDFTNILQLFKYLLQWHTVVHMTCSMQVILKAFTQLQDTRFITTFTIIHLIFQLDRTHYFLKSHIIFSVIFWDISRSLKLVRLKSVRLKISLKNIVISKNNLR